MGFEGAPRIEKNEEQGESFEKALKDATTIRELLNALARFADDDNKIDGFDVSDMTYLIQRYRENRDLGEYNQRFLDETNMPRQVREATLRIEHPKYPR